MFHLCILPLGTVPDDGGLHRSKRIGEWGPVSNTLHEETCLPKRLTDIIAVYALSTQFSVQVVEHHHDHYHRAVIRMPEFHFMAVECGNEPLAKGFLHYFDTIDSVREEDRYKLAGLYRAEDPRADVRYIRLLFDMFPWGGGSDWHEHIEYCYDVRCERKIANDVMLFDLPVVDTYGTRRVYRRLQRPWVARTDAERCCEWMDARSRDT